MHGPREIKREKEKRKRIGNGPSEAEWRSSVVQPLPARMIWGTARVAAADLLAEARARKVVRLSRIMLQMSRQVLPVYAQLVKTKPNLERTVFSHWLIGRQEARNNATLQIYS